MVSASPRRRRRVAQQRIELDTYRCDYVQDGQPGLVEETVPQVCLTAAASCNVSGRGYVDRGWNWAVGTDISRDL